MSNSHESLSRAPSLIDGQGVFAYRNFQEGEQLYSTTDYQVYFEEAYGTVKRSAGEHIFEEQVLRWINHSCDGNARIEFAGREVRVIAIRAVVVGDEVTCRYFETEDFIPIPFQCNCGRCGGRLMRKSSDEFACSSSGYILRDDSGYAG